MSLVTNSNWHLRFSLLTKRVAIKTTLKRFMNQTIQGSGEDDLYQKYRKLLEPIKFLWNCSFSLPKNLNRISAPPATQVAPRPPCISTSCPSLPNLIDSNPSVPLPSVSSQFPRFAPTSSPYPPVSFQSNPTAPPITSHAPHSYTNTLHQYPSAPSYQETFSLPQQRPENYSQDDTDLPPSFEEVMGLLPKKREQ